MTRNILKLSTASRLWFAAAVMFVAILNASSSEAASLKKGDEFKDNSGRWSIRVISADEIEIDTSGHGIVLGKYTVESARVRVVIGVFGTSQVLYYKLTPDGLVEEEKGGRTFYSRAKLVAQLNSALVKAAAKGNVQEVNDLLEKGADANASDQQYTVLNYALFRGNAEIVKMLLAKGARANASFSDGGTYLMMAGTPDIVNLLVAKGINVNAKTITGDTALIRAASSNNTEVVKALLAHGADVNAKTTSKQSYEGAGFTALIYAVNNGNIDMVKALLAKGADVNSKLPDGTSPLDLANWINGPAEIRGEIKKLLQAKGAK